MSAADALSNPITFGSIITLFGAVLGLIGYIKNNNNNRKSQEVKLENRITTLEQRKDYSKEIDQIKNKLTELNEKVIKMETKHDIMWASLEPLIIGVLHHPDPEYFNRDRLLEKFQAKEINEEELNQLERMLGCELEKPKDSKEYMAASLLIARIKFMLVDMGTLTCFTSKNLNAHTF